MCPSLLRFHLGSLPFLQSILFPSPLHAVHPILLQFILCPYLPLAIHPVSISSSCSPSCVQPLLFEFILCPSPLLQSVPSSCNPSCVHPLLLQFILCPFPPLAVHNCKNQISTHFNEQYMHKPLYYKAPPPLP